MKSQSKAHWGRAVVLVALLIGTPLLEAQMGQSRVKPAKPAVKTTQAKPVKKDRQASPEAPATPITTGTNIRNRGNGVMSPTFSPVTVIDLATIQSSGAITVPQLLRRSGAVMP